MNVVTVQTERLQPVALYSWISDLDPQALQADLPGRFHALGLQLYPELCSPCQLYAEDPADARLPMAQRVKVVVSRLTPATGECQVEVRSAEPMVRRHTRCQAMAQALQQLIPARGA